MDTRSRPHIWLDALYRLGIINIGAHVGRVYTVTEYPKSGGTWVGQMLAEALDIKFPRNRLFLPGTCVLHTHLCHSSLMSRNVISVFRDGRDVMVSYYFHCLFESDKNAPELVRQCRADLSFEDYDDVKANLKDFICYIHQKESSGISPYRFTWGEFVKSWIERGNASVKYEQMIVDPEAQLRRLIVELNAEALVEKDLGQIVKKYSFENQSKRERGQENKGSFLRKGTPGDWKNKFTAETATCFQGLYGEWLVKAGYEVDDSWVTNCQ